jgi:hypothetical protein
MNKIKIWWLKRLAKKHYLKASICPYDCGLALYHEINLEAEHSKNEFNRIMDKLNTMGESVPGHRL